MPRKPIDKEQAKLHGFILYQVKDFYSNFSNNSQMNIKKKKPPTICMGILLVDDYILCFFGESNPQPADYKSAALPVELHQHKIVAD